MVALDHQLVSRAYACITDSTSSHRIRELVFGYRLAVEFHNQRWKSHRNYKDEYERSLRAYVADVEQSRLV
jgi:hypothetical protein